MNNPFQEQLLKAGLVTKQQVNKANKEKQKQHKQQQPKKFSPSAPTKAQLAAQKKAERDRELNLQRQQQAKQKALSIEIDQLVRENALKRDENCEIAYNFEHRNKVHRLYVNADMKKQLIHGKLGIARIEGRYEIIPFSVADKIRQRNEKRVILFDEEIEQMEDEYKDYQIPDDLIW
jgi:uncharacterized protein YaiL (DUF2058 family)